jgi:diguanylate cyclase (GGDEF)-like protein
MESAPVKNEEYNHAALLYIDLDHFKLVNDKLGHHAGDAILKAVSARIAGILRHEDTIARIGGDEFVAILPEVRTRDVTAIADRIIQEIRQPFELAGRNVTIGLSIGIALLPHDARTEEELIDNADLALSRAKANGRGCYLYYDPELDARTRIEAQ